MSWRSQQGISSASISSALKTLEEKARDMKKRPTLETERLILRPFESSDAGAVQRFAGDRTIADTTLAIPHPYEGGMAEEWISSHEQGFDSGEHVAFAIVNTQTNQLVGAVSLDDISPCHRRAELGYWIGTPY